MITAILVITVLTMNLKLSGYKDRVIECADQQVEVYGDLCAESSDGHENGTAIEAHFLGVQCASESIKSCVGD